ncbi:hypothetical protein THAOC_29157, partial [Thalassiosira oceanica]
SLLFAANKAHAFGVGRGPSALSSHRAVPTSLGSSKDPLTSSKDPLSAEVTADRLDPSTLSPCLDADDDCFTMAHLSAFVAEDWIRCYFEDCEALPDALGVPATKGDGISTTDVLSYLNVPDALHATINCTKGASQAREAERAGEHEPVAVPWWTTSEQRAEGGGSPSSLAARRGREPSERCEGTAIPPHDDPQRPPPLGRKSPSAVALLLTSSAVLGRRTGCLARDDPVDVGRMASLRVQRAARLGLRRCGGIGGEVGGVRTTSRPGAPGEVATSPKKSKMDFLLRV